jgi:hypothetical protein
MDTGIVLGIIGIALGLLALAVGVPPFIQMIWGAPKLTVQYFHGPLTLYCLVKNEAVSNRFLRSLNVVRATTRISIEFMVLRGADRSLAVDSSYVKFLDSDEFEHDMRANEKCAFLVVSHQEDGHVIVHRRTDRPTLEPGLYILLFNLKNVDTNKSDIREKPFVVGQNFVETHWDEFPCAT